MKWMIATTLIGSALAVSISGDQGAAVPYSSETPAQVAIEGEILNNIRQAQVQAHKIEAAQRREEKMSHAINLVLNQVGKTPYVMTGDTPRGWDCSGLVMWMYSKLGIELPHSATAQLYVGEVTTDPVPGDIVIWGGGYHSGIYLGKGKTVNALNYSLDTAITDVDYLAGAVTYIHVY